MANDAGINVKDLGGYSAALKNLGQVAPKATAENYGAYQSQIQQQGQQFLTSFQNLIGRNPTVEEANQFYQSFVIPNAGQLTNRDSDMFQRVGDYTKQFINDNFQQAAKDTATQQLQDQQGQYNSLADLARTQGRQAISATESNLQDYQNKLFERLRPQLLTSLQAQGLLNTGGLNEAFAGAAKDLASETSNYLSDANLQNEQNANNIALTGASNPVQFQTSNITGQVPYLQAQGQSALDKAYQQYSANQDYARQVGLLNRQASIQSSMQPGLLGRLGQSFTTALGTGAGQALGSAVYNSGSSGGQQTSGGLLKAAFVG